MRKKRLFCAMLSALLIWTAGATLAEGNEEKLLVIEEEEDQICAAAAELGMAPLRAGSMDPGTDNLAAEPSMDWFEEKGLTLGESSLAYPALKEGTMEETLRAKINDRILADGGIQAYATRISQLISGGKLNVSWQGNVLGPVFSFAVSAEGAAETLRSTFLWTGGNIDLRDGHEVTLEELVTDTEAVRERMAEYLEYEVSPELSAHLQSSEVIPLPELFTLSERGITLRYPVEQLSTLSDRAGDILIPWVIIEDWLNLAEDSILQAMGADAWLSLEEDAPDEAFEAQAKLIQAMTAEGAIPGIPARLGEGIQALTDRWRMLIDPDVYALGRFFSLEGAAFRGVFLMTDYLGEGWENSVVDGIRVDLGSVYSLTAGKTSRAIWLRMLGEPEHTILFDEEQAEAYRTVPGTRDYYVFGGHRLQLHADADGILVSVILSE